MGCSTFVLEHGDALVAGHNLDESMPVPGMVVANPRGLAKRNVTYGEIVTRVSAASRPRLKWVSRFGSVTWNVFGREFPDGGMNEAGLYVAEMTLLSTVWPQRVRQPRMYHHQWIQFLLDAFATVPEAVASLATALPDGHCRWHFLLLDASGKTAIVEFLGGRPVVHTDDACPHKVLCNAIYEDELADLQHYSGFGGSANPVPRYEKEDPRFRWASMALREYGGSSPAVDFAFDLLERLDLGTTKWTIVCDIRRRRMHFRTSIAPTLRWIEIARLDFTPSRRTRALNIHNDASGDVTDLLADLSSRESRAALGAAWAEIDLGAFGNRVMKPLLVGGLSRAADSLGR